MFGKVIWGIICGFYVRARLMPVCNFQDIPKWIVYRVNETMGYFEWEVPLVEDTIVNQELQIGVPSSSWCNSVSIGIVNWTDPLTISDFSLDSYWKAYTTAYLGFIRTAYIQLATGMVYRVRVRSLGANCGWSQWSQVIYVSTPKNISAFIEVQGTGKFNPVLSYVNLNGTMLFTGNFDGFLLSVIERCTLTQVFQGIFDTLNNSSAAGMMATEIRKYNSNYLVIIVSSTAWETYFTQELSNAIFELGGYLTLPFIKIKPKPEPYWYAVDDVIGHPYAFIGVPGQMQITGQNFEVLRNTTQYFNYVDAKFNAIPTARIRVNLVFDTLRQFFMLKNNFRTFRVDSI